MENKNYWFVVVDDDIISLKNARDLLGGDDLRISSVRSGKELLVFMQKNQPDLILLDVMMPDMDGFETYQKLIELEEQEGRQHTPVIFLTGENDVGVEQKGLMLGASDFIRKPINRQILLSRLNNIMKNREAIENLTNEANTDRLTGFFNKSYAAERMVEICNDYQGLLMILDLDSFKLVNDLYGHDMGDNVLSRFAEVVRHNCREKDTLCRIGGDEFLAFFADTLDGNVAYSFTKRINNQLVDVCKELMGEDFGIPIGVSVGCVPVPKKSDYNALFQLADKALYQVKQDGKHGCFFYDTRETENDNGFDPKHEIQRMVTLCRERGNADNAMLLGQDAFISVYRYLERYARRHNEEITKVLVYLKSDSDNDKEEFLDAMSTFGNILQGNFRKNDVIIKCRANCYFLLLSEYNPDDEQTVMNRIIEKWKLTEYASKFPIKYERMVEENNEQNDNN